MRNFTKNGSLQGYFSRIFHKTLQKKLNHFSRILWKLEVSRSKFFLNLGTIFKEHLSTSSSISQPEALLQSTSEQHLEFVFITALLLIGILLEVYWIRERKNWISRQMDIESFSGWYHCFSLQPVPHATLSHLFYLFSREKW